jgi:UDP-N-acetylglucosamine:LPS N-acetylglucosamine transferase
VTGNPVRPEIFAAADLGDAEAASMMGLPSDRIRLVVFTGSLGSRKVNEAIVELAGRWRHRSDLAIHHVVGRRDFGDLPLPSSLDSVATGDPDTMQWGGDETIWYRQVAYEDRMGPALAAADVVVSRAGGSTVAELAVVGVPAVLVPLPIATRNHQQFNAGDLVRAGGAVLIIDAALSADSLEGALLPLLDDEAARERMAEAARSVGRPEAAALVADLVEEHASAR